MLVELRSNKFIQSDVMYIDVAVFFPRYIYIR